MKDLRPVRSGPEHRVVMPLFYYSGRRCEVASGTRRHGGGGAPSSAPGSPTLKLLTL